MFQFWFSWRHQIEEFSKTHKVVVPDLRGYNLSSKPPNRTDYTIDKLMLDVVELIKVSSCRLVYGPR